MKIGVDLPTLFVINAGAAEPVWQGCAVTWPLAARGQLQLSHGFRRRQQGDQP